MKDSNVISKKVCNSDSARLCTKENSVAVIRRHKKTSDGDVRKSYIVPVLSKAITIINLIESSKEPLNVQQIHDKLGYSKATIYRILHTLIAHGVLGGEERTSYSFRRIAEAQRVIKFTQGAIGLYKK